MEYLPESKSFKILGLSNSTHVPSGYGVQSKGMFYDWNVPYNVRLLCNYGIQGAWMNINGLIHYPTVLGDINGDASAEIIFKKWRPDLFITLYDIWMGAFIKKNTPQGAPIQPIHPHWIPICMIDHDPIPEATLMQAAVAYKVVTPTRFGEGEFKRFNVPVEYIPFGIDTKLFSPSEDKIADKEWLNSHSIPFVPESGEITGDDFVIVMVGANKDPYRKGFMRAFIALQLFFERNPDARKDVKVYLHSWMKHSRDIPHGAKTLHVEQYCRGTDDYGMLCSASEADMSRIYKAADLLIHPAQGGGFEIPILEALCSGVPVAGSDFVGMKELIAGHGWLIPPIEGEGGAKSLYFSPLDATQIIVDEVKLSYAIEEAYNDSDKLLAYGKAGREFAEGFDWSLVNPMWHRLFEDIRGEWNTPPLSDRRL